ncbi:hypothetical protein RUM43_001529 [Polyplax serrata]|uniref:Uncharacterized protein n=1 Tax=Polyplax serrata TaxID=468196 RepID=A0AAN8SE08_POLSC
MWALLQSVHLSLHLGQKSNLKESKEKLTSLFLKRFDEMNNKRLNKPLEILSGEKGYLEGLASRYADLFNTHYGDVLEHLEELRKKEWNELSPRICVIQSGRESPGTPPGTYSPTHQVTAVSLHNLTTSLSQPIYVPGKYSPSSCLSDKEEDEIYGFAGYGVYGKQMLQRQQQRKLLAQNQPAHAQGYQTCLSPRSAYFYEFPPTAMIGVGCGALNFDGGRGEHFPRPRR